jgi:hypothetical protein
VFDGLPAQEEMEIPPEQVFADMRDLGLRVIGF